MRYPPGLRAVVLALLAMVLVSSTARADDDTDDDASLDDVPHITMVGTAHVEARPDLATITLGVTTEQPSAKAAGAEVARRARAVIDAAKADGVPDIDIATQTVTLTQTFDPIKDRSGSEIGRKPRGFAADNTIAFKVRDLGQAGALAEALIAAGANRFDGIGFSVEHPEPILARLTGEAVKNARARAQSAAEAAGSHLGRVLQIAQPGGGGSPVPFAAARGMVSRMAMPAVPVEAGTATLSSAVAVTWALDAN